MMSESMIEPPKPFDWGGFIKSMQDTVTPMPELARQFRKGCIVFGSLGGYKYVFEIAEVNTDEKGYVWVTPQVGFAYRIAARLVSLGHVEGFELHDAPGLAKFPASSLTILRHNDGTDRIGITADEYALLQQLDSFGI